MRYTVVSMQLHPNLMVRQVHPSLGRCCVLTLCAHARFNDYFCCTRGIFPYSFLVWTVTENCLVSHRTRDEIFTSHCQVCKDLSIRISELYDPNTLRCLSCVVVYPAFFRIHIWSGRSQKIVLYLIVRVF